jgi:hypothetical protein
MGCLPLAVCAAGWHQCMGGGKEVDPSAGDCGHWVWELLSLSVLWVQPSSCHPPATTECSPLVAVLLCVSRRLSGARGSARAGSACRDTVAAGQQSCMYGCMLRSARSQLAAGGVACCLLQGGASIHCSLGLLVHHFHEAVSNQATCRLSQLVLSGAHRRWRWDAQASSAVYNPKASAYRQKCCLWLFARLHHARYSQVKCCVSRPVTTTGVQLACSFSMDIKRLHGLSFSSLLYICTLPPAPIHRESPSLYAFHKTGTPRPVSLYSTQQGGRGCQSLSSSPL